MNTKRIALFMLFALVFSVGLAPAATTYNTGDGSAAWGGDPQVAISNISSPPWAPNGTTGPGSKWVNKVDSGFQGGGPNLGDTTTYFLNMGYVSWFHIWALADDGAQISASMNGNPFVTLVNSSGAPQATNCSSLVPSCPASMVWDSGTILADANVVLRFITSQDVGNTPVGLQATVHTDVPEPATYAMFAVGLLLVGLRGKFNHHARRR